MYLCIYIIMQITKKLPIHGTFHIPAVFLCPNILYKYLYKDDVFTFLMSQTRVKRTFAIRFRYLLMNAVALRPVSGSF